MALVIGLCHHRGAHLLPTSRALLRGRLAVPSLIHEGGGAAAVARLGVGNRVLVLAQGRLGRLERDSRARLLSARLGLRAEGASVHLGRGGLCQLDGALLAVATRASHLRRGVHDHAPLSAHLVHSRED